MSDTNPPKVAVIGCGAVAELYYAPALRQLERAGCLEVAYLFDPQKENIDRLSKEFPRASLTHDLADLLFPGHAISLAIIASPARYHAAQSIEVLDAGINVLCEKPMATNGSDAGAMIETARRKRCVLAAGMLRRFFPATQLIKHIIQEGLFGRIKSFDVAEGVIFSWPARSASFFKKEQAGGGVLIDLGVHVLDLLHWWFGQPEEALYEDDAMGGVEANCKVKLTYTGGIWGTIRLSRDTQMSNRYAIQCENGRISWTAPEINRVNLQFEGTELVLSGKVYSGGRDDIVTGIRLSLSDMKQVVIAQLKNVIAASHGHEELVSPGEEAVKTIELIEACYQKRTLIKMGWLSEAELLQAQKLASGS